MLELFEVVQSQPVTFPPDVPASEPLKDLLLRMLEKVRVAGHGAWTSVLLNRLTYAVG